MVNEEKYLVIKVTTEMVRHFTYNNKLVIVKSMVMITEIYLHRYDAILKNFLNSLYHSESRKFINTCLRLASNTADAGS